MNKIIGCIIVRSMSSRLPLKALRYVDDKHSSLDALIKRMRLSKQLSEIYVCTTTSPYDDVLEDISYSNGIKCYRGAEEDVIERLLSVGEIEQANYLVRITGDNVFTDPYILDHQIEEHLLNEWDYSRTENVPLGVTAEVMSYTALMHCAQNIDRKLSEYLMLYMYNPDIYKVGVIDYNTSEDLSKYILTMDTSIDLKRTREIFLKLNDRAIAAQLMEILEIVKVNDVQDVIYEPTYEVKLPMGEVVKYVEFRGLMEEKKGKSMVVPFYK
ncbi:hypothetical protein ABE504_26195 [Paenibacillus oryzisoli]|uniref:cytidylyltransferase domain-containing protein n=1 Tax=Paenibacillus oryzisoli TaxID=1850517 RepID=UPI003D2DE63D